MRVWVLTEQAKTYAVNRLKEEAKKQGIQFRVVNPKKFELIEPRPENKTVLYNNKYIKAPDCVIARGKTNYFYYAVIRYLENMGVYVVNSAKSIDESKDKLKTIQILATNNIPIPKTMFAKLPLDISFIKKEFSFPLIMKTTIGSQGKGVVLCEKSSQLEDIIDFTTGSSAEQELNVIFQEFISSSKGRDIRVFLVGGRPIGAMLRTAVADGFKANYSIGGSVENFPLNPELEWLAVESTRLLGLEIAGVDILFDKKGYRICEVNSSPGFKGFEEATGINVPQEIFRYLQIRTEGFK